MTAYTAFKRFAVQAAASNSGVWGAGGTTGDDLNTGVMGPLDYMLAGISTFSVSSSNVSLSFTAGGGGDVQNCMFRFTGTLLSSITVSPAGGNATTYFTGFYMWENLTSGNFTITLQNSAGGVVLPQGRRGVVFVDSTNGVRIVSICGSSTADPVPAASAVMFYNASAPSGWTAVAINDYNVKLVTNGGGGVTSGSVAYSTLFGRTSTDAYTLLTADIPSHTHGYIKTNYTLQPSGGTSGGVLLGVAISATSDATGGGGSHSHAIDMRVQTAAFVLATRN